MLETLKAYQAWRRGEDKRPLADTDLTPTVIGLAIDWAIERNEQLERIIEVIQHAKDEQVPLEAVLPELIHRAGL
jgi:hypothetical protein